MYGGMDLKYYRDVEKRLAELERRAAWTQPDTPGAVEVDALQVIEILMECGLLPTDEDYADEEAHADALIAELARWRRTNAV
jgi:hypothetical protein